MAIRDVPIPVPARDEVLVRVRAASVNRADLDGLDPRPGFVRLFIGVRRPRDPRIGIDVAGVVESVGPGVTRFQPGDRVFADLFPFEPGRVRRVRPRARAGVPADPDRRCRSRTRRRCRIRRSSRSRACGGATAGRSGPGDKVLIDGASGNVGPFAVQIAKSMGAEVTGVCQHRRRWTSCARSAPTTCSTTRRSTTRRTGERYDWIVDTDSHHSILRVRRALRPNGVYVTLGGTALPIIAGAARGTPDLGPPRTSGSGLMLWWKPFRARRTWRRSRTSSRRARSSRPSIGASR